MSRPTPTNDLIIRTPRLILRPMTIDDAPDIFLIRSDPETLRYTPITPDSTLEQTRDWIRKLLTSGTDLNFSIELRGTIAKRCNLPPQYQPLKAIGFLSAMRIPEMGYGINRHFWNKGYMTEALEGFKTKYWKFFPRGYPGLEGGERDCLIAQTDKRNQASQAVLKKCGFEWWKEEKKELKGEKITVVWYRVRRPAWGMASREKYDWRCEKDEEDEGVQRVAAIVRGQSLRRSKDRERFERREEIERDAGSEDGLWATLMKGLMHYVGCSR